MVWVWMFIAGLGVGPTFAVFTIIVQNAVPFQELGVATSNLTFFRQIGGSVGLAIVGTIFGTTFQEDLVPSDRRGRGSAAGRRRLPAGQLERSLRRQSARRGRRRLRPGQTILGRSRPRPRPSWRRYIDAIVQGIYAAFSLAVAQTFYIAVGAADRRRRRRRGDDRTPPADRLAPAREAGAQATPAPTGLPISTAE